MVSPFCQTCLSRLRPAPRVALPLLSTPRTAPFHTTAALAMFLKKKKPNEKVVYKHRVGSAFRMKKKRQIDRPRPPPAGERQALRKRIVLSNPNALEVEGMKDLSPETMVDTELCGSVVGIPMPMLDQLRASGGFKPRQGWAIFRRPGTVMRRETLEMGKLIDGISGEGQDKGKSFKSIISGIRGSGKTVHLLQAMTMAFAKKWVVFTVPEAQDLVIGHTGYAPIPDTNPTLYAQGDATGALLSRAVNSNKEVLSALTVSREHPSLGSAVKPGMKLTELANVGINDRSLAWSVFQALWTELTATSPAPGLEKHFQPRPPVLVTVDGLAHWMKDSAYRSPEFKPIHAHDLAFVKHFLSLLKPGAEKSSLPNGGGLVYALSISNRPSIYAFDVVLKQLEARQAGVDPKSPEFPQPDPYLKADMRVIDAFKDSTPKDAKEGILKLQTLGGLSQAETRGYLEYFARSGIMRENVNDECISEKWTLAAGGVVGELEKLGKRVRVIS